MSKEYDLIRELGYGNWIDETAGEAVLWGYYSLDPELESMGTQLSHLARTIKYDDDRYATVEALAKEIKRLIEVKKEERSAYIETIASGEATRWPSDEWQYAFACIRGVYQIRMTLPSFFADSELDGHESLQLVVMKHYKSPDFTEYEMKRSSTKSRFTHQSMWTQKFFDDGFLLREIVVHEHQDDGSRGFNEIFYFKNISEATKAWTDLRAKVISDQKR